MRLCDIARPPYRCEKIRGKNSHYLSSCFKESGQYCMIDMDPLVWTAVAIIVTTILILRRKERRRFWVYPMPTDNNMPEYSVLHCDLRMSCDKGNVRMSCDKVEVLSLLVSCCAVHVFIDIVNMRLSLRNRLLYRMCNFTSQQEPNHTTITPKYLLRLFNQRVISATLKIA